MKIVHYKPFKVTNDVPGLAEVIIIVIVRYHGLLDSIVTNRVLLFTLKFWSLLSYFFGIKRTLSIAFYLLTNGQTKRENSTIEAYLQAFVNFKQNDWVRLLPMAEFAYNNAKNTSTSYTFFKLNWRYYLCISYNKDLDPHSKLRTAEELSSKPQELMTVC